MNKNLVISKNEIAHFCRKNHIRQLSVFGSALKEDFGNDSDVDILVEFHEDHVPGFAFFDMELELSQIIGRKVDLNTPNFLSRYFRDSIIKTAEVQYVQS
jgi:predicted nucleotidyltransferase